MALTSLSIDEILTLMADAYDALITPFRIFRDNNNKFWLAFRAIAAGYNIIIDSALSLHNRFNPLYCDDVDLYTTALLVGTQPLLGSGSLLQITATNNNTTTAKTLLAGTYQYTSTTGELFQFTLVTDVSIAALGTQQFTAISVDIGGFLVTATAVISVVRSDNTAIDSNFSFSAADNSGQQGYPDESAFDFRNRILNDPNRQDQIAEIELAIRNLPNIFECNIVFNASDDAQTYDGVSIDPYQMLLIITGAPSNSIADQIVQRVIYNTKEVDSGQVVYYYDTHYIGGQYPVYFAYHGQTDFQLSVEFQYDSQKILESSAQNQIDTILNAYRNSTQHVDILTEDDIYTLLKATPIPSVRILNVNIIVSTVEQNYLIIPKTRMPNLTAVSYIADDVSA